jgi:hypothetical protein
MATGYFAAKKLQAAGMGLKGVTHGCIFMPLARMN